jgi:hypothetical protein
MTRPCTITIEYGSYKWVAREQNDKRSFLVHEYQGGQEKPINTYAVHEDALEGEISGVLEGSVA